MTSNYNECFYFDAEKDNASSMLKKCINGPGGEWAWPCSEKVEIDNSLFGTVMERPSGDNSVKPLPHSNEPTKHGPSDHGSTYESMNKPPNNVEGFTNMGEHYVRPGDCPDGYKWCNITKKCKQVCMNCKYNQRTYGKSKEFNEGDYCFPNRGVYNGITNQGLTKCTCGSRGQYCGDNFNAQGGMFADNVFIMNVGNFGKLGTLAAY